MLNIGFTEFLIIGIIIIVCVDARKLPQLARTIGKLVGDIKRTMNEVNLTDLTKIDLNQNIIEEPPKKPSVEPLAESKKEETETKS